MKDQTKFSQYHLLADAIILTTMVTVLLFATENVKDNGWAEDAPAVNSKTWFIMVGYSVFVYEGIGVIIPVQSVCKNQKAYPKIIFAVVMSIFVAYTIYGIFVQ